MMIRKSSDGLEISISPDDCILLSRACRIAADETQEDSARSDSSRATSYLYYLMACCLDGYALATDAHSYLTKQDREVFTLEAITKAWNPLPVKGGAR